MENVLERASAIAAEKLKVIQAPAKAKAEAEAKVAAETKAKADEQTKKDEGTKLAQVEAQNKEDERILTVEDKQLSESELARKTELKETKRKKDESPDEKIKRVQESSQKRIDEIKSELLSEREHTKQEMATLKAELEELKKPRAQEDAAVKSKREETERITKYVEEDKTKPKEDRREMSPDELQDWYLEDPVKATEWMQERTLRRVDERKKAEAEAQKPKQISEQAKKLADEFISKQNESKAKLANKYPGVLPSQDKIKEVKKELGFSLTEQLSQDQLTKIKEKLSENEEFRLASEIVAENPKKYLESINGPELVMAEIEKRLNDKGASGSKKITLTEEELEAKIQAEAERRSRIDGEGLTSTSGGKKLENNSNEKKSDARVLQEKIARKAGISTEQLDKSIQRRRDHAYMGGGPGDKNE